LTPGATSEVVLEGDDGVSDGADESASTGADAEPWDVEAVPPVGEVAGADGVGEPAEVPVESPSVDGVAVESVGSAQAVPGIPVATAVPTPSATASAPTRPTYLA
jgi:hypothetical protein